jgi:pimeloyl-ACP methyl ester carboxylesterase
MALATCVATALETHRPLAVDGMVPDTMFTSTHAITIDAPPEQVWPWIAQMGGGRAGWYSWDAIDNGGTPSARRVVPELQTIRPGDVMPAVPGATDAFVVAAVDPPLDLILTVPDGRGDNAVAWEHFLQPLDGRRTRLIVRGRASSHWLDRARTMPPADHRRALVERAYAVLARLPRPLLVAFAALGHRIMEARHLRGIQQRSTTSTQNRSSFKTPEGETRFLAAYDATLQRWPVPCEQIEIPGRFGTTHVVVSGPKNAPPLVLLHGYMATSVMWSPNIVDFAHDHRVYAIDTMGQPKSIPGEPIRSAADYVEWLDATLDALRLDRIDLVGMSFGGWLALKYAVAAPERVQKLVLLSAGGFLPIARQFSLRGMLMVFFPTRFTVNSFMRWAGFTDAPGETDARRVLDVMYLGMKYFRMPSETLRVAASPLSDDELRALQVPVLLLMGDDEVLYDADTALDRARRLVPDFEGELIPRCRHDMCFSQHRVVDARVLEFLKKKPADVRKSAKRSVA